MGTRAQVLDDSRRDYTRRLLDAVPIADPTQRRTKPVTQFAEPQSLIRSKGATVPRVTLSDVGAGHLVAEVS